MDTKDNTNKEKREGVYLVKYTLDSESWTKKLIPPPHTTHNQIVSHKPLQGDMKQYAVELFIESVRVFRP